MCRLTVRLFVAALTFVVGVSAGALWGLLRAPQVDEATQTPVTAVGSIPVVAVVGAPAHDDGSAGLVYGGILNGKALSMPSPEYPAVARKARAEGTVVVSILIDETGRVVLANTNGGHPLLQAAAERAAREARFAPTRLSGRPVKVSGQLLYNFVPE